MKNKTTRMMMKKKKNTTKKVDVCVYLLVLIASLFVCILALLVKVIVLQWFGMLMLCELIVEMDVADVPTEKKAEDIRNIDVVTK